VSSRLHRWGRSSIVAALLGTVALLPVPGVAAFEVDKVTYDPSSGEPMSHHVDVFMAASDGGEINTPDECALVPSCTMVPLEITPLLDRGEDEDWLVGLEIAWEAETIQTPNNAAGSQKSSDLDVYLYHWGPLFDSDGEPKMDADGNQAEGYIETGRSVTGDMPEVFKLFRPSEVDYYLVVMNFFGVNDGFDLHFSFTDASFGGVGEFGSDPARLTPPPPDDRLSFGDAPAQPFVAPATQPVSAPPTVAAAFEDDDFGFAASVPEDLLAADDGPIRGSLLAERTLGPPADVGTGTILLWLVLLPVVLAAAAVALVVRRRPSALSLRFPARAPSSEAAAD